MMKSSVSSALPAAGKPVGITEASLRASVDLTGFASFDHIGIDLFAPCFDLARSHENATALRHHLDRVRAAAASCALLTHSDSAACSGSEVARVVDAFEKLSAADQPVVVDLLLTLRLPPPNPMETYVAKK